MIPTNLPIVIGGLYEDSNGEIRVLLENRGIKNYYEAYTIKHNPMTSGNTYIKEFPYSLHGTFSLVRLVSKEETPNSKPESLTRYTL